MNYFRKKFRSLKLQIKWEWRKYRGLCVICAGPKDRHKESSVGCYHCASNKNWCHQCNKRMNHAANYGMRGDKLIEILYHNGKKVETKIQ